MDMGLWIALASFFIAAGGFLVVIRGTIGRYQSEYVHGLETRLTRLESELSAAVTEITRLREENHRLLAQVVLLRNRLDRYENTSDYLSDP